MASREIDRTEAARLLPGAARILVIGCSGSGKSTLAWALAERFGLLYLSMDREVFWLPGWRARPRDDANRRIAKFVALPRWVMDGTSPRTLPERLARADLVIWLRPPRHVSFYGIMTRWFRYAGRTRPEMARTARSGFRSSFSAMSGISNATPRRGSSSGLRHMKGKFRFWC